MRVLSATALYELIQNEKDKIRGETAILGPEEASVVTSSNLNQSLLSWNPDERINQHPQQLSQAFGRGRYYHTLSLGHPS